MEGAQGARHRVSGNMLFTIQLSWFLNHFTVEEVTIKVGSLVELENVKTGTKKDVLGKAPPIQ